MSAVQRYQVCHGTWGRTTAGAASGKFGAITIRLRVEVFGFTTRDGQIVGQAPSAETLLGQ